MSEFNKAVQEARARLRFGPALNELGRIVRAVRFGLKCPEYATEEVRQL